MGESAISEQMVLKNDDSLILTAPVMIPNFRDCDFHRGEKPLSVEEITDFRRRFEDYGFVDRHHSIRGPNATKDQLVGSAVKSFQLEKESTFRWVDGSLHTYPPGTWMLTSRITDKSAIKQVQNGEITGYSASVFNDKVARQIRASLKESDGDLIKDVKDPTVAVVSLVRKPCVSDAKFCNLKGEKMSEETAKSKLDSITKILGFDKTEYASKGDVEDLKSELESTMESYKEDIAETVDSAIKSALTEFAIKEKKEKEKEEEEEETEESEEEYEETEEKEESSDEETDEKKKKEKPKGSAKGQKIHNGQKQKAIKSDSAIVYEIMGRSSNGDPVKE